MHSRSSHLTAISTASSTHSGASVAARSDTHGDTFTGLDVIPHPHQRRMLEDLMVQRDRHGRHRNLVVAATGTGKTVVAALDYAALVRRAGRPLRLLFVAHRDQILNQSRATFRAVLKDPSSVRSSAVDAGRKPASTYSR